MREYQHPDEYCCCDMPGYRIVCPVHNPCWCGRNNPHGLDHDYSQHPLLKEKA